MPFVEYHTYATCCTVVSARRIILGSIAAPMPAATRF